jgi:hypothetical protein
MEDLCNCNYDDHILNHIVESKIGYINPSLNLWYKNDNINNGTIISVKSFLYEYDSNIIKKLQNNILNIKKYLYEKKIDSTIELELLILINNCSDIIINSPIVNHDIIVYRGIDKQLNLNIGDILIEPNFLFTSIHISYALLFLNDTSKCYINDNIDTSKIIYTNKKNTLFKLTIPANYHFYENNNTNDINMMNDRSEIILNFNTKFLINNIINMERYILVEALII